MNLLHHLYLVRFSLLAAVLLFFSPIIVVNLGLLNHLLGGLFDLPGGYEVFWAVCFAYLLSFSALIATRITLLYGPERCGMTLAEGRFIESRRASIILFAVSLLLPVPLIVNAILVPGSGTQGLGALVGFLTAFVIVFGVDFLQRLFNTFRGGQYGDIARHLFFPFSNPLSAFAERSNPARRFFSSKRFARFEAFLQDLNPKYGSGYLNRKAKPVTVQPGIVLALVMFVTFVLIYVVGFYFWSRPLKDGDLPIDFGITTITYVFVLLTMLCWLLSGISFLFDRFRFPTILVVLFILLFTQIDHKYDVWKIEPGREIALSTPAELINARKNDRYIVFVAANGGGIQASAWTAEVLTRFEEECRSIDPDPKGCKDSIALISGVSGGSVGAMYFMEGYNPNSPASNTNELIRSYARRSSLKFVGGGLVFNDLVRNVPFFNYNSGTDRGKQLARGWIDNKKRVDCEYLTLQGVGCDGTNSTLPPTQLNGRLSDWANGLSERKRPAVIFNSTIVESGRRLLFSTARFTTEQQPGSDWLTFGDFAGNEADIDVVEAVRLSATFPYVTPAANMVDGVGERRHFVVDGGYFDNYGLMSVRDFIVEGFAGLKFTTPQRPKIIVLQIYGDEVLRNPAVDDKPPNRFDNITWLAQTVAPLGTLLSVRQTGQYSRNLETYNDIVNRLTDAGLDVNYVVLKYSNERGAAPLSWHLSGDDLGLIDNVSAKMRDPGDNVAIDENVINWRKLKTLIRGGNPQP